MRSRILAIFGLATTLLGPASTFAATSDAAAPTSATVDSNSLFAAQLVGLKGLPANLSNFCGKPLLVNFWARWCGPCKVEMPELVSLTTRNKAVQVIGLNIESNTTAVREFVYAYDLNYPVYLTGEGGTTLIQNLGNPKMMLPFTVAINSKGTVVATHLGVLTREKIDQLAALASQSPPKQTP